MAQAAAAGRLAHRTVASATSGTRPNVVKEIGIGLGLGVVCGAVWKIFQVNEKRKTEDFYASYEKGEITVLAPEE